MSYTLPPPPSFTVNTYVSCLHQTWKAQASFKTLVQIFYAMKTFFSLLKLESMRLVVILLKFKVYGGKEIRLDNF